MGYWPFPRSLPEGMFLFGREPRRRLQQLISLSFRSIKWLPIMYVSILSPVFVGREALLPIEEGGGGGATSTLAYGYGGAGLVGCWRASAAASNDRPDLAFGVALIRLASSEIKLCPGGFFGRWRAMLAGGERHATFDASGIELLNW